MEEEDEPPPSKQPQNKDFPSAEHPDLSGGLEVLKSQEIFRVCVCCRSEGKNDFYPPPHILCCAKKVRRLFFRGLLFGKFRAAMSQFKEVVSTITCTDFIYILSQNRVSNVRFCSCEG